MNMEEIIKEAKQNLQFHLDWETNRFIDKIISELNEMRPARQLKGGKRTDEGVYDYECKDCNNGFVWYEVYGEPKYELCPECLEKKIIELETKLKTKPKKEKENIKKTYTNVDDDTKRVCDNCGDEFVALYKINENQWPPRTTRNFCSEDCQEEYINNSERKDFFGLLKKATKTDPKKNDKEYLELKEQERIGKRKKTAMKPEVKNSDAGFATRSESQQLRRAQEKRKPVKQRECIQCGKTTTKLYCTDKCRKDFEQVQKKDLAQSLSPPKILTTKEESDPCAVCGKPCPNTTDFVCSDECSDIYWNAKKLTK